MEFNGSTFDAERDGKRLTAQLARVRSVMGDGAWRTLAQLSMAAGAPEASVSARLRDLRKFDFGANTVERTYLGNGLYSYRLVPNTTPAPQAELFA